MKDLIRGLSAETSNVAQKGFFHLFTVNGLIYLIGFASQLVVAGLLEPAEIGQIKIMQTYVGIASIIIGLGFNTSMIKILASVDASHERSKILQFTLLISSLTFVLVYGILLILNYLHLISPDDAVIEVFPFYALYLLPLGFQSMFVSFYQAERKIQKMAKLLFIGKVATISLIILLTFYIGLRGYVLAIFLGALSTNLVLFVCLSKPIKNGLLSRVEISRKDTAVLWNLAKFVFVINLIGNLVSSLDIYFVNFIVVDRQEVGYYMFALMLVGAMNIFPMTVQQISYPYFSEKFNHISVWYRVYKKYNFLNHVLLILSVLAALIAVPIFIKIVFRGKYDQSLTYFPFLLIAWLFNYLNNIRGTALMGAGRFDLNLITGLITLSFTVISLSLLSHFFRLEGVIAAKIFAGFVAYLSSYLIFKKYIKKNGLREPDPHTSILDQRANQIS